jgi:hypothetical protein
LQSNGFASRSASTRNRGALHARDRRVAPWRCGWCSRDREGVARAPAARETTGICTPCLDERRGVGFRYAGPCFVVWDEDAREAARWATELRAAGAAHAVRRAPS